jgi:hypothetical protein
LQQRQPGQYQARVRLPRAGDYQLVFYLDSPKIVHCFPLTIQADPSIPAPVRYSVVLTNLANPAPVLSKGVRQDVQFSIRDAGSGAALRGVKDVEVLLFHTGHGGQVQLKAQEQAPGTYGITFSPLASGYYYLFFQAPSLNMRWNQTAQMVLKVN